MQTPALAEESAAGQGFFVYTLIPGLCVEALDSLTQQLGAGTYTMDSVPDVMWPPLTSSISGRGLFKSEEWVC